MANLVVAIECGLVVLVLLRTDHRLSASERGLLLTALLPITMLALRASPWLAASNAGAIGVLVGGGVLYHRTGSFFDGTPARCSHEHRRLFGARDRHDSGQYARSGFFRLCWATLAIVGCSS